MILISLELQNAQVIASEETEDKQLLLTQWSDSQHGKL